MYMIVGDIYRVDSNPNLVTIGIVSESVDAETSYFEGWELTVAKRSGRLMSAQSNGRYMGPGIDRLVSQPIPRAEHGRVATVAGELLRMVERVAPDT